MLIKCTATGRTRSEILDIAKIMNANIVDLTKTTMTLEICDLPDRLDLLEADRADKDYRSTAYPQAHSLREIRKKGGTP